MLNCFCGLPCSNERAHMGIKWASSLHGMLSTVLGFYLQLRAVEASSPAPCTVARSITSIPHTGPARFQETGIETPTVLAPGCQISALPSPLRVLHACTSMAACQVRAQKSTQFPLLPSIAGALHCLPACLAFWLPALAYLALPAWHAGCTSPPVPLCLCRRNC